MAELYRRVKHFKSTFTRSSDVSEVPSCIDPLFGLTEQDVEMTQAASNLHHLGKVAVISFMLEKTIPITKQEMAIIKPYAYSTYSISVVVEGLHQITDWAGFHQQRLDG
ncbi:MAG: hypothetical protein QXS68_06290 [Candidatus Methanomethylicaceae archaeon]